MTTEVFINGTGWVDLPDTQPEVTLHSCEAWTPWQERVLSALHGKYPDERIGWALGRTVRSVRARVRRLAA